MLKFSCIAKTLIKSLSNFLIRWNNLESSKERMIIKDIIRDRNKIMREVKMKVQITQMIKKLIFKININNNDC